MGVSPAPTVRAISTDGNQDDFFRDLGEELDDKGFVVTNVDKLVNWARRGLCGR